MSYNYQIERPKLFTEDGVVMLLKIRDNCTALLRTSGGFRAERAWQGVTGDSWMMLAALDFLCERNEIEDVSSPGVAGQHRLFVGPR